MLLSKVLILHNNLDRNADSPQSVLAPIAKSLLEAETELSEKKVLNREDARGLVELGTHLCRVDRCSPEIMAKIFSNLFLYLSRD